ncbi:MAG: hypothetical protein Q9187_001483 [Circinaria calcarea]
MPSTSLQVILNTAETKDAEPIEEQSCPLCKILPGKSQRTFAKHVGRHMETIALAVLPRETEDDSDESSLDYAAEDSASISVKDVLTGQEDSGKEEGNSPLYPSTLQLPLPSLTLKFSLEESKESRRWPNPDSCRFVKDIVGTSLIRSIQGPEKCPLVTCEHHKKGFACKRDSRYHALAHYDGSTTCGFCSNLDFAKDAPYYNHDAFKRHLTSVHGVDATSLPSSGIRISPKKSAADVSGKCCTCSVTFYKPQELYDHLDECVLRFISSLPGNEGEKCSSQHSGAEGTVGIPDPPRSPPQLPNKPLQRHPDDTAIWPLSEDAGQVTVSKELSMKSSKRNSISSIPNVEKTLKTPREALVQPHRPKAYANIPSVHRPPLVYTPTVQDDSIPRQTATRSSLHEYEERLVSKTQKAEEERKEDSSQQPTYCYCDGGSYGEMMACDNAECEKEWFHLQCIGLTYSLPRDCKTWRHYDSSSKLTLSVAKWYCRDCVTNLRPMHYVTLQQAQQQRGAQREATPDSIENITTTIPEARRVSGHTEFFMRRESLVLSLIKERQWKEAEKLEMEVVTMRESLLGAEHADTLHSMGNLVKIYNAQRKWEEAEKLGLHVMETRKKVLGAENMHTLDSMEILARIFSTRRQWKEAEKLEVQVMELKQKILGEEHPDTLDYMGLLARTYFLQNKWIEAESLQIKIIKTRERVLGPEHADTLDSMGLLVKGYCEQKRWKEAEELQTQILETKRRALGAEHPSTRASMASLVNIFSMHGREKSGEL